MTNKLCDLLGTKYPIIQGAMAWIADSTLAASVSEAGGLGIIASGNAPADYVRTEIRKIKELTKEPFGVNILLMSEHADEIARVVCEEGVKIVTTGAGNPGKYMDMWKKNGIKVIPVVPSAGLAKRMERNGADAVVAEGCEAGGHIGELTTMALIPQVADAVKIPVVAAGGIGDGRGVAAAFMLGASGVQLGTRFLIAHECNIHRNYKDKILNAKDIDTVVTGRCTGHPVRVLKNKLARMLQDIDMKNPSPEKIEELGRGSYRRAVIDGDLENGSFMSGQIAGLLNKEQSSREIIEEIFKEAEKLLGKRLW